MTITVLYFAALRERRGCERETLTTTARTLGDLYAELRTRHGFALESTQLGFALGDELVPPGTVLRDGTTVAFLPPVSGG